MMEITHLWTLHISGNEKEVKSSCLDHGGKYCSYKFNRLFGIY